MVFFVEWLIVGVFVFFVAKAGLVKLNFVEKNKFSKLALTMAVTWPLWSEIGLIAVILISLFLIARLIFGVKGQTNII